MQDSDLGVGHRAGLLNYIGDRWCWMWNPEALNMLKSPILCIIPVHQVRSFLSFCVSLLAPFFFITLSLSLYLYLAGSLFVFLFHA